MSWSWWWTPKFWYMFTVWQQGDDFAYHEIFRQGPVRLTEEDGNSQTVDMLEAYQGQPFAEIWVWRWSDEQRAWLRAH